MRVRLACLVLGALLVPALAHADSHIADYYFGYSQGNGGSTLKGFSHAMVKEFTNPKLRNLGIGGDFTVHFGSHDDKDVTQVIFMGEGRYTLFKLWNRALIHAQGLLGGVYTNDGVAPRKKLAGGVGLAADICFSGEEYDDHPPYGWALRLQGSYVNHKDKGDLRRFSVGLVYRFPPVP